MNDDQGLYESAPIGLITCCMNFVRCLQEIDLTSIVSRTPGPVISIIDINNAKATSILELTSLAIVRFKWKVLVLLIWHILND